MKIYTSYFYQIRNMNKDIIPLSTAVWDPKWFHDGKHQGYAYLDDNGVYIGLRAEPFVPGIRCRDLCRGPETCKSRDPHTCDFLSEYRRQLDELDFNTIMMQLDSMSETIMKLRSLKDKPDIALVFHEAPGNPCSERHVVTAWFKDHGYEIEEFRLNNTLRTT